MAFDSRSVSIVVWLEAISRGALAHRGPFPERGVRKYGHFSGVQSGKMGSAPGRFEL